MKYVARVYPRNFASPSEYINYSKKIAEILSIETNYDIDKMSCPESEDWSANDIYPPFDLDEEQLIYLTLKYDIKFIPVPE